MPFNLMCQQQIRRFKLPFPNNALDLFDFLCRLTTMAFYLFSVNVMWCTVHRTNRGVYGTIICSFTLSKQVPIERVVAAARLFGTPLTTKLHQLVSGQVKGKNNRKYQECTLNNHVAGHKH